MNGIPKILKCVQRVSKNYITEDLVQYVENMMGRDLTRKMFETIELNEGYIFRLAPMTMVNSLMDNEVLYQQELQMCRLIFCKDCEHRKPNKFCLEHMRYEDDYNFCSHGEEQSDDR